MMPTNPVPIYERGTPAPLREYIRRRLEELVADEVYRQMMGEPVRYTIAPNTEIPELSDAAAERLLAAIRELDTDPPLP